MLEALLLSVAVMSQDTDEAADAYRACAAIEDRQRRLECFDAAADGDDELKAAKAAEAEARQDAADARAQLAEAERKAREAEARAARLQAELDAARAQAAAEVEAARLAAEAAAERQRAEDAQRVAEAEQKYRELEEKVPLRATLPERFEAEITQVVDNPDGTLIMRLDNGQTWRQLAGDRKRVHPRRIKMVERAYVRQGAVGNWLMAVEPLGMTLRVAPVE